MDRRLLTYYNRELQHVRETAAEFAREFPKIAGRLALEEFTCADPYVERLLEGFAFLSARVQLKLDSEFPTFTQGVLDTVYPHYLAPTPSMAIVQLTPDRQETGIVDGFPLARGSSLRSVPGRNNVAAVEYRTAHDVTLWPFEIDEARYFYRDLGTMGLSSGLIGGAKAALRLRLKASPGVTFDRLSLDALPLFIRGAGQLQTRVYEHLFRSAKHVIVMPSSRPMRGAVRTTAEPCIRQVGFDDNQAMLPYSARSFRGYRLLQEYFALPQRFLFFEIPGLSPGMRKCAAEYVDIAIMFSEADPSLEGGLEASNFVPFCTPVVNLFPKRCDRVHVTDRFAEFHIVPDRTRPRDFEVYQLQSVTGYGARPTDEVAFQPFYSSKNLGSSGAYYTSRRVPRMTSEREARQGSRTRYDGSDLYIALVDPGDAPYSMELRQLGAVALCTNRDLPLLVPTGGDDNDFSLETGAPVTGIKCVGGVPTAPRASAAHGEIAWRLISSLTLNYLSLSDTDEHDGPAALRELLGLYADTADLSVRKQIDGVKSMSSRPVVKRIGRGSAIAFGRGLELTATFDEAGFEGTGAFLFGAVLERFFAKYVSINSFTKTVVRTIDRGEVMQWPARVGQRQIL